MQLLYVTSSSYSGSTLLAFLLNNHPEVFTISEMEGWAYEDEESYPCSCGAPLPRCPFFGHVAEAFRAAGEPFDFRDFGTAYRLVASARLNRWLTERLPPAPALEGLRDAVVARLPVLRARLARHDRANRLFLEAALAYSGARVFVDATKNPFRLRFLRRLPELDLRVVHLVRDYRGVALSNLRNRGCDLRTAIGLWLREQRDILRVCREFPRVETLRYEALCDDVDAALARLHRFLGLEHRPFPGSFKAAEHHILGNTMRLDGEAVIRKNEAWREAFDAAQLAFIEGEVERAVASAPELGPLVAPYREGRE